MEKGGTQMIKKPLIKPVKNKKNDLVSLYTSEELGDSKGCGNNCGWGCFGEGIGQGCGNSCGGKCKP